MMSLAAGVSQTKKVDPKDWQCGWVRTEFQSVSEQDAAQHFIVGLVRAPCDTLLSLWAYGSKGEGAMAKGKYKAMLRPYYGKDAPNFSTHADVDRFNAWVQQPPIRNLMDQQLVGGLGWQPKGKFDGSTIVDCWVSTD